jgi:hypothetical protein
MQIKITNEALYNAKKVEAEFIGGTLSIVYLEDDTIKTMEVWGEIGATDYAEEFGFTLTSNN